MELEIIRADPAGNITVFVLNPVAGREKRAGLAGALMADPLLKAEQVGFVLPPADGGGLWRLEMTGGEFCGNAARSFGLYAAGQTGITGRHSVPVEISGAPRPLPVLVDTTAGTAELAMPGPLAETSVECGGRLFPVYVFDGISHAIAEDIRPDENLIRSLRESLDAHPPVTAGHSTDACHPLDALGVMFYDSGRRFMRPLVWVRATGTTVFESSCGSGSAALGVWLARNVRDGGETTALAQPGGTIEVRVLKREGIVQRISIGGKVSLSAPILWCGNRQADCTQ
ncbi:MAG: hypothetical protein LBG57_12455 [Treponema sp.]|jgi:diaminopimelate epimerase|nr:hypothetical protein [Treponema sp.]